MSAAPKPTTDCRSKRNPSDRSRPARARPIVAALPIGSIGGRSKGVRRSAPARSSFEPSRRLDPEPIAGKERRRRRRLAENGFAKRDRKPCVGRVMDGGGSRGRTDAFPWRQGCPRSAPADRNSAPAERSSPSRRFFRFCARERPSWLRNGPNGPVGMRRGMFESFERAEPPTESLRERYSDRPEAWPWAPDARVTNRLRPCCVAQDFVRLVRPTIFVGSSRASPPA